MTRLTKAIRQALLQDVLDHRYQKHVRALLVRAKKLGDKLYNETYSPEIQKQMAALPPGFISKENSLHINLLGRRHAIYFGLNWSGALCGIGHVPYLERSSQERLIAAKHTQRAWNEVDISAELRREIEFLNNDIKDHNEQYGKTCKQVEAALAAANTIKKLIELWPEIEPFASFYKTEAPVKINLPAIPVASLNAMLDLPVDTTA